MTHSAKGSRAARLTKLVTYLEQLADHWQADLRDPAVASAFHDRHIAGIHDLEATRALIAGLMSTPQAKVPHEVLVRLHDALAVLVLLATRPVLAPIETTVVDLTSRAKAVKLDTSSRKLLKQVRAALLGLGLAAGLSLAMPVAAGTAVGDTIINPETGISSVILKNEGGGKVVTDKYLLILTSLTSLTAKDATDKKEIIDPTVDGGTTKVKVVGVTINALTGQATKIRVEGAGGVQRDIATFVDKSADVGPVANPPSGPGVVINPPASDDKNTVLDVRVANNGSNGRNGGGFKIFGVVIGVSAGSGGAGQDGESFTRDIPSSHGLIETVSDKMAGVRVGSVGGGGGRGGDAAFSFGIDGGSGGKAGKGGNVTVTNNTGITTKGVESHGMHVYSRSGAGGVAGTVEFGVAEGGTGGAGNGGGTVTAYNYGAITTKGKGAIGVLVQSLGGESGEGGSSYGIVGRPGSSLQAGTGGSAYAYNFASVNTSGQGAHGVVAQSIGGTGGQAGDSIGIVALGNDGAGQGGNGGYALAFNGQGGSIVTTGVDAYGLVAQSIGGGGGDGGYAGGLVGLGSKGGAAGHGGKAEARLEGNGRIVTTGKASYGIFAQSIGGGGGNGGVGGGLAGVGGEGAGGGNGGEVTVVTTADTFITTQGESAHAIFAESVGKGGGVGGTGAGIVGVGGSGDGGGNAGFVSVTNAGRLITTGKAARGIFAQSVGGGGGAANGTGGLVSVGGSAGGGGIGGRIYVKNTGSILTGNRNLALTSEVGSDGIFAQSLGGGGGSGSASGGLVSLGGKGGGGGAGGQVDVDNDGIITTQGVRARGIFAQSVGGGGGTGGDSGGLVSIGGTGGSGTLSTGGAVTVTNKGTLTTKGAVSSAIQAQSIGGGGGDGGTSGSVLLSIGGAGKDGGNAGTVIVNNYNNLKTEGNDSHGIFAQAVGGGGGNGGSSTSVSAFVGVSVGGEGGKGGDGGKVETHMYDRTVDLGGGDMVTLSPLIYTKGDRAIGIFAQSVGGGGGNGGFAAQTSIGYGISLAAAVGGKGGEGGKGGLVDLTGNAVIRTEGGYSAGVFAQSVGGGGGNGGFSVAVAVSGNVEGPSGSFALGLGGKGGKGGFGDKVTVNMGGAIQTTGAFSTGLLTQSVGGGGGNGGFNVSVAGAAAATTAVAVGVGVGGAGGDGGDGGVVDTRYTGDITTAGYNSTGALIQSVGGGGGSGGFNVSAQVALGTNAVTVGVGVGGAGGKGGHGKEVWGIIDGDIVTGQVAAAPAPTGITQQDELQAALDNLKSIQSAGLVVQSVGGGGGSGGFNITGGITGSVEKGGNIGVGLGGSGGTAGDGGIVHASARNITTHADQSPGFLAQSVGGGGGVGGMNITGGIALFGEMGGNVGVGLGGGGGGGGAANAVDGTVVGEVRTSGNSSDGIVAQSLGGSGGAGGLNVTGGIALTGEHSANIGVSIGGAGGKGGNSGTVVLKVNESVADPDNTLLAAYTQGDESDGVVAQSIGGGGGNGGISVAGGLAVSSEAGGNLMVGVGGAGGGTGNAEKVTAVIKGDVVTRGKDADGIMIQSLGGTGGNGGFNVSGGIAATSNGAGNLLVGVGGVGGKGGHGGSVNATVTGDVQTGWGQTASDGAFTRGGDGSAGVTFQSLGGGGGNGGFNVTGGIAVSMGDSAAGSIGVGVGGFAGGGGNASSVVGSLKGNVRTYGDKAHGVLVQSLGGAGGNGGFNVTGNISGSSGPAVSIGFGLGGFGGDAGHSIVSPTGDQNFAVRGTLNGDVQTYGNGSYGAALQSLGGGGGTGGFNVTGNIAIATGNSGGGNIGIGIGGFGGKGGNASGVWGDVRGNYQTNGNDATAVSAVSQGGGGGNGGFNVTGSLAVALGSGQQAGNFGFGLGGFGGGGGNGAKVELTRVGDSETFGKNSTGVFVQSLGGGGGKGAFNVTGDVALSKGEAGSLSIGIGGFGGKAGHASTAWADVTGDVYVRGDGDGVVVQSVGGGGGDGAINITGQLNLGSDAGRGIAFGLGGFGGEGGNADWAHLQLQGVSPTQFAQVVAKGDKRSAVKVQSVGGSGGDGAINITGGIATKGTLAVGIGGFGSDGGEGKSAFARVEANLFASGNKARGLLVQSVGGGGGDGGINFSGAANKSTEFSIAFGLGGFGGDGNKSSDAQAFHRGQVVANGINASGIVVQSVAGGGGDGGLNVAFEVNLETKGKGIAVGVGGTGGDGANAGLARLTNIGSVFVNAQSSASDLDNILARTVDADSAMKLADHSHAILVQSVGGGGGVGGVNVTTAITPKEGQPLALGVGGSGGSGGNGGIVELTQGWDWINGVKTAAGGTLRTYGDGSIAVMAQSIGGGGGDAGMNVVVPVTYRGKAGENPSVAGVVAVGGSGAGAGYADMVTVDHKGTIITGYKDSVTNGVSTLVANGGHKSGGILAQSIGGGGGNADLNLGLGVARNATALAISVGGATGAAGKGGKVNVYHDGGVFTNGDDATAIMAQSIGGGGGNASTSLAIPLLSNDKIEVNIGRRGGAGGQGDEVMVRSTGTLETHGNRSSGILAQSIGGGGGVSGTTAIGAQYKDNTGNTSVNARVAVGLEGGSGARAEKVEVHTSGFITTTGKDSYGILAQSIGGGGGVGGLASNTVLRATASVNVGVGGKGGTGALAGKVKIYNAAEITTGGDNADGIMAQSIGGGGGTGGNAGAIGLPIGGPTDDTPHSNLTMSVGGRGGVAAWADEVYVENSGIITTGGTKAFGIRAQSIGGGGGFGGTILNVRLDTAKKSSATVSISAGGEGDDGGLARLVTVHNTGSIWTTGEGSIGISATSIGGGGGDGGGVADFMATAVTGGGTSGNVALNFGGSGGKGGKGGEVIVTNKPVTGVVGSGQIVTKKDNAYGIFAQSLGGGGGNGGAVVSVLAGKGKEDSISFGLNIGGSGDTGGTGGKVTVTNDGLIDTTGKYSHGILAQSIGGGGGNGGMVIAGALLIKAPTKSPLIAIGGSGGDGGASGTVTVTNNGTIVTRGAEAHGIFAQSVGGGGGNSSMGFSLSGNPYTLVGSNALAALIGALTSGDGGAGGQVNVTNTGNITVLGDGSYGIMAESINGGGGHLSLNFDSVEALFDLDCIPIPNAGGTCVPGTGGETGDRPPGAPLYSTRIGSTDSSDFNAGKITIINTGTIVTRGANSVGDATAAVGGGGGKLSLKTILATTATTPDPNAIMPVTFSISLGSVNGTNTAGGDIETTQAGMIASTGRNSVGVRMQSIGGGGGDGVTDLTAPTGTALGEVGFTLGSTNGTNQTGGAVGRTQTGAIVTGGDYSTAVQLQSIGGGGGTSTALINAVDQTNLLVKATLGADGGTVLGGGSVTGSYDGLQTTGNHSVALLAQSIGAGGGSVLTSGGNAVDVTLGGKNGASGNGGEIKLTNAGIISTSGIGSHAVLLQSIGGGGGAVLTDGTTVTTHLNSGNTGDGGPIDFTQTGDIVATGARANGLIAQSLGGGGGWVDGVFAGTAGGDGKGGAIVLNLTGGTFATGTGGTAVLAQSLGKSGAGNISIVSGGTVRGYAAGIRIDGGATNTVTTSGSVSAVSGVTISAGSGNDRVINTGLVVGNIDLGSGSNAFENRAGSTFVAFSTIDLRDPAISSSALAIQSASPVSAIIPAPGGTFANDGDFLMGLSASPRPIDLAKGATFANLDAVGTPATNLMYGSRVINTVALDGNFVQSDTGHMAFDVAYGPYASDRVNVTGNTTVDGKGDVILTWLENAAPMTLFATAGTAIDNGLDFTDTIAMDYRVLANTNGIQLAFTSDFAQPFLNRNQGELGRHMDSAISLGGSGGIGRVMALLGNMQVGDESAYAYVFDQLNPEAFLGPQTVQLGAARQFQADLNTCGATGRDTCVWARVAGSDVERTADAETYGYNGAYDSLATGFERRVDDKWSIAGAVGFDRINRLLIGNGRARMEGDSVHAGIGATRTIGSVKLGLGLTGGLQTLETQRMQNIFEPLVGTATPHTSYLSAQAKLSRRFDHGAWFFEPAASLAVTSIHQGAFTEKGLEGQGAAGVSNTQTFATLTPELTVGYRVQERSGQTTALSFNVGAVVNSADRLKMPFRLVGSNQNSDPALISSEFDNNTIRMGANLQVTGKNDRASLNLSLSNENGKRYSQQTFSAAVKFKF